MKYQYPECRKSDLVEEHFGEKLECPYTWLRNTSDEEVLDFTARENAFTDAYFDQDKLHAKMKELKDNFIPDLPSGISPWKDGYIASFIQEGNTSIIFLNKNFEKEKTLFERYDLPKRTPLHAEGCPVDDSILGILCQIDNDPMGDVLVYDTKTNEILGSLPMTFSGDWSKAKKFYYAASTVDGKTSLTRFNVEEKKMETVFTYEKEDAIYGSVHAASNKKSIVISVLKDYSNQYFYVFNEEDNSITSLNEEPCEMSYVDTIDGKHYFITHENTVHGKLVSFEEGQTVLDAKDVLPESEYFLEHSFTSHGNIYLLEAKDGSGYLYSVNDKDFVKMPVWPCSLYYGGSTEDGAIVGIDSFLCYPQLLEVKGTSVSPLTKGQEEDPDLVVTLEKATSKDGTEIPYYFIRRKDAEKDGSHPAIMFGYGGYNTYVPPRSNERGTQINIRKWVQNGGVHIHTLLRGGNEYGPEWHEGGMRFTKKNCYDDSIAIAEKVIQEGWTKPERFVISGCSNGGLLVTALLTMRPDLWGCVIASVPHTDMIHFAYDDRGPMYVTEYGDPDESKEMYEYLLSYSPIHNVKDITYPPIYIQTGECDNNVPPYHGKSFAARMQVNPNNENPVLLRVLKLGAHDRGQGEAFWQTISEMQLFIEEQLHLKD